MPFRTHDPNAYVIMAVLVAVIVLLGFIAWITRFRLMPYFKQDILNKLDSLVAGIHLIGSILGGLAIPNNYLVKFTYFKSMFEENGIWIPISMLCVTILIFTVMGLALYFLYKLKPEIADPTIDEPEIEK